MKKTVGLLLILGGLMASIAFAGESVFPYQVQRGKYIMTQGGMPYWYRLNNPAVADTDVIVSQTALDTLASTITFSAAQSALIDTGTLVYSSGNTSEIPRSVDVTISAPAVPDAKIKAGTFTLTGTNLLGETITETYTVTEDTAESLAGAKAFLTITTLACPAMDSLGVKVSVGRGLKAGLPLTLPMITCILWGVGGTMGLFNASNQTFAVSATAIESNTVYDGANAYNGTNDYDTLLWVPPLGASGGTAKW